MQWTLSTSASCDLVRFTREASLAAGDIPVIKAGEIHSFRCIEGPLIQLDVHLSPRFIQENLRKESRGSPAVFRRSLAEG